MPWEGDDQMNIGAVIPAEILSRTDLPIYVKLVYGRMTILLERHGSLVLTTEELANQCGITQRQAAKSLRYLVMLELIQFHRSLGDRKFNPRIPENEVNMRRRTITTTVRRHPAMGYFDFHRKAESPLGNAPRTCRMPQELGGGSLRLPAKDHRRCREVSPISPKTA